MPSISLLSELKSSGDCPRSCVNAAHARSRRRSTALPVQTAVQCHQLKQTERARVTGSGSARKSAFHGAVVPGHLLLLGDTYLHSIPSNTANETFRFAFAIRRTSKTWHVVRGFTIDSTSYQALYSERRGHKNHMLVACLGTHRRLSGSAKPSDENIVDILLDLVGNWIFAP